jgi:hypothetical protein
MKTPRIEDFDPNANVKPLKSPLDGMPTIGKPPQKSNTPAPTPPPQKIGEIPVGHNGQEQDTQQNSSSYPVPPVRDVPPVRPVPPVPPKRVMKQRWPVDVYQDQYEALKQLALEERMQGGVGSMNAMVREALDKLIAERRGK